MAKVTKKSNPKGAENEILKAMGRAIEKVLANTQLSIVRGFTDFPKPPIDSGQLRQSISYRRKGATSGEIVADKNYAIYVEYGTSRMPARPFMRQGVAKSEKQNAEIITSELNKINDVV